MKRSHPERKRGISYDYHEIFHCVQDESVELINGLKLITTPEHFLKRMTDLGDEFTVMKHDLNRVKEVIREKLGVDLT